MSIFKYSLFQLLNYLKKKGLKEKIFINEANVSLLQALIKNTKPDLENTNSF